MMKKNKKITKDEKIGLIIGMLLAAILFFFDKEGIVSVNRIINQGQIVMYTLLGISLTVIAIFLLLSVLQQRKKRVDRKSVYEITNIDDFRNIQRGQEFTIKGIRYYAMQSYDFCKGSVWVCRYKDYPNGGYDFSESYPLMWDDIEHVFNKKTQKKETAMDLEAKRALRASQGRENLKSYESYEEVIAPPCYKDEIHEIYDSYKSTGYRKNHEKQLEKLRDDFPLISEEDLNLLIKYFKEADDYCEHICCEFAGIYDTVRIPRTAEAEVDKNRVIKICMTRYPWMTEEGITSMLSGICWLCNR